MARKIFREDGQTLLEVALVALLFLLVMTSLVTAEFYWLRAQKVEVDEIQAAQLAREGIEMVKNIRDSNWLNYNLAWLDGLSANNSLPVEKARLEWHPAAGSAVLNFNITDINNSPLYEHPAGSNNYLNYDQTGGQPTGFYRLINLEKICDEANFPPQTACGAASKIVGLKVTADVAWQRQGQTQNYQLSDYLYNWK